MVIKLISLATRHLLLALLVLVAIASVAARVFLAGVDSYKTDLEHKIFELTSIPIDIGTLGANMRGISPEVILKDIKILKHDLYGRPIIQLEEVRVGINPIDLLITQQLLPSSWLTLVGAQFSVIRQQDGSLSIVGLSSDESEQPFWLLKGGKYELLNSHVTWLDQQKNNTPVVFNHVDLLIKNKLDSDVHEVHLMTDLPQHYGDNVRVSMSIQGNDFDLNELNGLVYIEANDLNLKELFAIKQLPEITVQKGVGTVKLWSRWEQSTLSLLEGSVQAKNTVFKEDSHPQSFQINTMSGNFKGLIHDNVWQFDCDQFNLSTDKKKWSEFGFSTAANKELTIWSGNIAQANLGQMTTLVKALSPMQSEAYKTASKLALTGQLKDLFFYIDIAEEQFAFNGLFENISFKPHLDLPQVENLSGAIKGNKDQGRVTFHTLNSSVFSPGLLRKPILINQLSGSVAWEKKQDELFVFSDNLIFDTKDFQTENKFSLSIPEKEGAVFADIQTAFGHMQDVSHASDYYPASIMGKDSVDWLDKAFVSGAIEKGNMLVYGELDKFPFLNDGGVFEILYGMENINLHYHPDWPNLKNATADVLFSKNGVSVDLLHAESRGLTVKRAIVDIPSFDDSNHLLVDGVLEGKIVDTLTFLQKTPLQASATSVLDAISPKGSTQIKLDLKIPLVETVPEVVNGTASFNHAVLNVKSIDLDVTKVTGALKFTEKGLFSDKISANALGYPINIKVQNEPNSTRININGKTNVTALKKQFTFMDKAIVNRRIKGTTNYSVKLNLPEQQNQPAILDIQSFLSGVEVDFPSDMHKTKAQKKPLNLRLLLDDKALLPLELNYNNILKVAMKIDRQQGLVHSADIAYGNNDAAMPLKKELSLGVNKDLFDLSAWKSVFNMESEGNNQEGMELNHFYIDTENVLWNGKRYGALKIDAQRSENVWKGKLSSAIAAGEFTLPLEKSGQEKLDLEMTYLKLSKLLETDLEVDKLSTEDMPLIRIVSEQLWWNNENLGRLEIETKPLFDGISFKYIHILSADHKVALTADWLKSDTGNITEMKGSLVADDFGLFLSKIGFKNDLLEASGQFTYSGSWPGAPYQFSLAKMDAETELELVDGRISSIEPGFGRILGLIAMEQWIKRLTLDFGDVYKEGLSFNKISGHFSINQGKAKTADLMVDSVPADISIYGEADLLAKSLNHHVTVVPKSSGALPIAGTIVGQIAGGITQLFDNEYKEGYFFGSKYKITGFWDQIEVMPLHEQDGIIKKTWSGLTDFSWMQSAPEN